MLSNIKFRKKFANPKKKIVQPQVRQSVVPIDKNTNGITAFLHSCYHLGLGTTHSPSRHKNVSASYQDFDFLLR